MIEFKSIGDMSLLKIGDKIAGRQVGGSADGYLVCGTANSAGFSSLLIRFGFNLCL